MTPTYTVAKIHEMYDAQYELLKKDISEYSNVPSYALLDSAYNFAIEKHVQQVRKSGEPYFDHLFNVAAILTEFKLDLTTIACGLLHDVIEDTDVTPQELTKVFNQEITDLVDGVTKITSLSAKSQKIKQGENFRKMILSTAKDLRVILVKFADRLHNMRTLKHMPAEKRTRIAKETRDVFAPLAHRFGLHKVKSELEDLSLKYLDSDVYYLLKRKIEETRSQRDIYINKTLDPIRNDLNKLNIKADISGRPKHFYSIYNKMIKRNKPFEEIYDLLAIRIIVDEVSQCYFVLGVIHSLYLPVADRFKDYIATPKINGYQSLHTTVIGPDGKMVEIQIRTLEMHQHAEEGIAAHWRYKHNSSGKDDRQTQEELNTHLKWLHQFVDRQDDMDSEDFIDNLKIDLFKDEVFIYSPQGDLFTLPADSCALDFAFHIHSDIGIRCASAKVNGRIAPLHTKLKNGDIVEIITSKQKNPNPDWLHIVVTGKARHYIKRWIKEEQRDQSIHIGKEIYNDILKRQHINPEEIDLKLLHQSYHKKLKTHFYEAIGRSEISIESLVFKIRNQLQPEEQNEIKVETATEEKVEPIKALGIDSLLMNFGKCCNPVPGDIIKGYVTSGHGITIHRSSCKNLKKLEADSNATRIIHLTWEHINPEREYLVRLNFFGSDRKYLMRDLSEALSNIDIGIKGVDIQTDAEHNAFGYVLIYVKDLSKLNRVMSVIQNIPSIQTVYRDENIVDVT